MSNVKRFKTKPVEIEAIRRSGDSHDDVAIIQWLLDSNARYRYICTSLAHDDTCGDQGPEGHDLIITTLEGDMKCPIGWWVIRGLLGEFYPCDPEAFDRKYQEV